MANLDLQIISSGDSLDDEIMNNNINVLNAVPLTGTTLNDIPTFSPDTYISAESINNVFTKIKENWIDTSDGTADTGDILDGKKAYVDGKSIIGTMPIVTQATPSISIDSSTGIITVSATQAAGYVGAETKTIEEQLQTQAAKRITPSKANITAVAAGKYTTGDVIVDPVPTQSKTVTPTTSTQRITPDNPSKFLASVTVTAVPTQTKSVIPNTSAQTVTPDNGKFLSSVTVNAIPNTYVRPAATKAATTYTPTAERQIISAGTYCTGQQTIEGDADLVAGNIKSGVNIFGVSGTYTSDATAAADNILYGETAYVDGKKVTGTIATKTSNDLTVRDAKVLVPAGYYATNASKSVSTVAQANPIISVDSTTGTITASVTQGSGYVYGRTMTNTSELQTQPATTITPSAYPQTAVRKGYYTTGVISVAPVPTQTKSVTPSKSRQTVTPDSGKFLSSVTIGGIPSNYITTSDATATESDIAEGVIAYANGKKVEGNVTIRSDSSITSNNNIVTIPAGIYTSEVSKTVGTAKSAYTYIPTTYNQSISSGYYLTGTQTIAGDANLVPSNIKSGVSIFGVEGNVVANEGDIYFTEILRATDITSNGKTDIANVTFDFDNYSIHITPTDVLDDYTIDRIRRVKHISLEIDIHESGSDYKGQFVMYSANSTAQTLWHWMYIQEYDGELDYYDYGRCSYDMDDSSKVATFSYTMSAWEDVLDYIRECDSSPTANGLITWQIL